MLPELCWCWSSTINSTIWMSLRYVPNNIPLLNSGGIRYSGDVVKGSCGTSCVMLGSVLAGVEEVQRKQLFMRVEFKTYRGMGSIETIKRI